MAVIGDSVNRVDAFSKVTGQALYPGDLSLPGMLHMKILFARRPHARIRVINTRPAEALPGVVAVLTAKDVPVNEYGLQRPDQPVLCGPGSDKPGADVVRFVGDQVAVVVAESEKIAAAACERIEIDWEDLPVVADPFAALAPGAPQLIPGCPDNVIERYRVRRGDVEEAFRSAEVIVEGRYQTPYQEHAYLQPEAGLAYVDEQGRIAVEVGGQWTHDDQKEIAHALNLPLDQVRVIYPAIGGAFGGREDMSVQIVLALAAWKLRRPVKIIWSREESIIGHHKRHPMTLTCKWGATRDGRVVAAEVDVLADGGAYCYTSNKVLGNTTLMCTGPYDIPNIKVDTRVVYTNNVPTGAFRGFGGPQGLFAAELQMEKLAEALNMDPVELRWRNMFREGSLVNMGTPLPPGVSLPKVVERAALEGGWQRTEDGWKRPPRLPPSGRIRRGIGFAAGFKNVGFSFGYQENCWARIELHGDTEIKEVVLYHASAEVGQGVHTIIAQMAAEAVGVPVERVRLVTADTASSDSSGSVSASRMTFMAGNAIHGAAERAMARWLDEDRPAIGEFKYLAPATTKVDPETGYSKPNFAYGYVAQVAEVEVDLETGQVRVPRLISVNDVGRAINRQLVEGQIEGAVVQALGYVLMENLVVRNGQILTPYLSTYLIPTALDVPIQVKSVVLEEPDPIGPWGARGMAEMPFLPVAPAVVAAVHDATGVWLDSFPLTPERVRAGLARDLIERDHGHTAAI